MVAVTTVFRCRVSALPLVAEAASLIEKETSALWCLRGEVSGVGCQVSAGCQTDHRLLISEFGD
jgi:hypothetical protein